MEPWRQNANPNVIVEAIRLNEDNIEIVAATYGIEKIEEIDPEHTDEMQWGLNVITMKGTVRASLGMYVYKFGNHFFVAHNRPFEMAYTPVNREPTPPESAGDSRKARGFADPFDMGRRQ